MTRRAALALTLLAAAAACSRSEPSHEEIATELVRAKDSVLLVAGPPETQARAMAAAADLGWTVEQAAEHARIKPVNVTSTDEVTSFVADLDNGKYGPVTSLKLGFTSPPMMPRE
ncbi:hypothetical protein ACFOMD_13655 [Sphingoaurantiacus capsulatus]|uniref:Lipoprotein n=1 Tax=Sphingoaurantiacus capsulatus TaxID=1771310 RepID=A0ABV7XCS1_9SPHN